jgi:hypothetical protein
MGKLFRDFFHSLFKLHYPSYIAATAMKSDNLFIGFRQQDLLWFLQVKE